jgi:hypothetical protein
MFLIKGVHGTTRYNGNEYETIDVLEKEHKGGNANKKEEGKRDSQPSSRKNSISAEIQ